MEDYARIFGGGVPVATPVASHVSPFPTMIPQMIILSHKTHSEETITKNGVQKTMHVVVKNSPFYFSLGMMGSAQKHDFNQVAFESSLLYDCDGDKEVDFVKSKPMEFKYAASENGQQLDVELRIKVLSSQHEDLCFRVKIRGIHPISKQEIPGLCTITPPIKVISKPEQLKKKQPSKKRSLTELLVDTVARIEKKQEDQQRLIERMFQQQAQQLTIIASNPQTSPCAPSEKRQRKDENTSLFWDDLAGQLTEKPEQKEDVEFEDAFANLLKAYTLLRQDEKPEAIRKLIRNSSTRDVDKLSEFLDLFWVEGLQKEPSLGQRSSGQSNNMHKEDGCCCADCPHKQELERIDEFYKEFLCSGVSMTPNF